MPANKYLLTIDIGNTTTALALLKGKRIVRSGKIWTDTDKTFLHYYAAFKKIIGMDNLPLIKYIAISSVVPELDPLFRQIGIKYFGIPPFFVNHKNCGIKIRYSKPSQVGADRLANAVAGKSLFGTPLIIIDFGTAITFDCISKEGTYAGGIIMPGAELAARALHEHTSKLPEVKPFVKPASLIGNNTNGAILSGIYFGLEGSINNILKNLKIAMQCDKIVLTGGHAGFLKKRIIGKTVLEPGLTHTGIRIIWENNQFTRDNRG